METLSSRIFVTFQKEGIHFFPGAVMNENLEVDFLRFPHRHMFHFRVEIDVKHDNREIEFILFKRWLESLYKGGVLNASSRSCEMMCDDLAKVIAEKYPGRYFNIEVSEDGENGSIKEYQS